MFTFAKIIAATILTIATLLLTGCDERALRTTERIVMRTLAQPTVVVMQAAPQPQYNQRPIPQANRQYQGDCWWTGPQTYTCSNTTAPAIPPPMRRMSNELFEGVILSPQWKMTT